MGGAALAAPLALAKSSTAKPVRIAFVGLGNRGTHLLQLMLAMPGVSVPALCDINQDLLRHATEMVKDAQGNRPAGYSKGLYDYRRMFERDDVDAVLVATPSEWHARMSLDAMHAGKHVASESPGAQSVEECWNLVKTCEATERQYMLIESSIHDHTHLLIMNMAHAGVFGEPYYGECSYTPDHLAPQGSAIGALTSHWETKHKAFGTLCPTRSLGPVSKWMGLNRGDRPVSLVSMMSKPPSSQRCSLEKRTEDLASQINVTLIKTARNRVITIYYNTDGTRPMTNFNLVQGTNGVYDSRHGVYIPGQSPVHQWENSVAAYDGEHGYALRKPRAKASADSSMLREFVQAVREGRTPFVDVYDSATWSAVAELSAESIRKGGVCLPFPDFTNGRWNA
jgi:predicted dehydrogenase